MIPSPRLLFSFPYSYAVIRCLYVLCTVSIWIWIACSMSACSQQEAQQAKHIMTTLSASDSVVIAKVRQGLQRGVTLCENLASGTYTPDEQSAYLQEVRVIHKLSKAYLAKFSESHNSLPMADSLKNLFEQFEKTAAKYHIAVDSTHRAQ